MRLLKSRQLARPGRPAGPQLWSVILEGYSSGPQLRSMLHLCSELGVCVEILCTLGSFLRWLCLFGRLAWMAGFCLGPFGSDKHSLKPFTPSWARPFNHQMTWDVPLAWGCLGGRLAWTAGFCLNPVSDKHLPVWQASLGCRVLPGPIWQQGAHLQATHPPGETSELPMNLGVFLIQLCLFGRLARIAGFCLGPVGDKGLPVRQASVDCWLLPWPLWQQRAHLEALSF